MATISQGILGPVSGKIGNLIFCISPTGRNYVRSAPRKNKQPPTPAQLAQRERFRLANAFLKPLKEHIQGAFRSVARNGSPMNSAMKIFLSGSIVGQYPHLQVDFPKVCLSRGGIPPLTALRLETERIDFPFLSWAVPDGICAPDRAYDTVKVIAYNAQEQAFYCDESAFRSDWAAGLPELAGAPGDEIHVYAMARSLTGRYADSRYAGSFVLTEPHFTSL